MEFSRAIFSILMFSLMVVLIGLIITEMAPTYNSTLSSDLGTDFNKIDEIGANVQTQQGNINPQSGEASSDYEQETFRGVYGIITNIFVMFRGVYGEGGMLDSFADRYGVPLVVIQVLSIMFIFAILTAIIAIVFKLGRTST